MYRKDGLEESGEDLWAWIADRQLVEACFLILGCMELTIDGVTYRQELPSSVTHD